MVTARGVRFQGRYIACSIGKGGISRQKREGDGATAVGAHRIVGMLYRADRMAAPVGWAKPILPGDLWSDDVADPDYNMMVRAPHGYSHETLRRADPLYDLVLITDWNWPVAKKGRGSAIFIHQWRRPGYPTEGCVAMSRANLAWVARRLHRHSRLIVQG